MNRVVNSKRIASDAPSGVMPPLRLRPEDCPAPNESASFTPKQGQYLAFIYAYTRVLRARLPKRTSSGISRSRRPRCIKC